MRWTTLLSSLLLLQYSSSDFLPLFHEDENPSRNRSFEKVEVPDLRDASECNRNICSKGGFDYKTGFYSNVYDNARTVIISRMSPTIEFRRNVTICVYSVWVGPEAFQVANLNHKQYCDAHGYIYKHFYMTPAEYHSQHGGSVLWYKVIAQKELLESGIADYYVLLDIDCVFARFDFRLESLLDPYELYSLYVGQPGTRADRFVSTQSWIFKGDSKFSLDFVNTWLSFRKTQTCGDISGEQGSIHFAIGMALTEFYGASVHPFECHTYCNTRRKAVLHYICALDWFESNGFGHGKDRQYKGKSIHTEHPQLLHPHIFVHNGGPRNNYIRTFINETTKNDTALLSKIPPEWLSPIGLPGLKQAQLVKKSLMIGQIPYTLHPCKKNPYVSPTHALKDCWKENYEGSWMDGILDDISNEDMVLR